ncbi:VWA domain-containing protein [Candidatus Woesearchaeota archaeon]|nr:VWA domain-containing protein [Candidatus Woesearchaeota archaeon]
MANLTDEKYKIGFVVIATVLAAYALSSIFGKADDWQYSSVSVMGWFIYVLIGAGVFFLAWLGASIYLIIKGHKKRVVGIALLALVLLPIIGGGLLVTTGAFGSFSSNVATAGTFKAAGAMPMLAESADSIGFAVGGAKDVGNFRQNIENGYLPLPTDITYEGLYYEYFFDTGETKTCGELFCPSYSYSISEDPFSDEDEYYLQVGLNSGMKESDFERKKLNLVIVLDISGSMGSSFNRYYYDQFGNRAEIEEEPDEDAGKSKMEIASKSVVALLDHLNDDDRFGMVLFESSAYLAKPLSRVGATDLGAIKNHILEIGATGGTNMAAGMKEGTALFEEYLDSDKVVYENRIIFLTDAMPNTGYVSEESLLGITQGNADNNIYTTFIGIGVDFNTELVEAITKIRGANYYSVHSSSEFKTRMDEEFEYMVTPLVFNLLLKLDAEGYEIEKVYGSPEADEATGEIMKVNTLFPSKKEEEGTKGGIVILKLKKTGDGSLKLTTSYEDRSGNPGGDEVEIELPDKAADYYENTGIRKGILLARYVNVMRAWIDDERESYGQNKPVQPVISEWEGIPIPPEVPQLGRWERQSIPLQVSEEYKEIIAEFSDYFESEASAIGDETLSKETELMAKLTAG